MPVDGKTRDDAWAIVTEFTDSENLRRHMLAVEAAMRGYAKLFGEDEEKWGLVGLLHDFDYEKYQGPNGHPFVGVQILDKRGWPREVRRAILSHANYTGVPRETRMEKALYAVDELAGFLVAAAVVRPSRSFSDLTVDSVKKKMKDKSFCAAVDREHLKNGATELGVAFDKHVENVVKFLRPIEAQLGLGTAGAKAAAPAAKAGAKAAPAKPAPAKPAAAKPAGKAAAPAAKKTSKTAGKKSR